MAERIHGLDVARAFAIYGMVAVNVPLAAGLYEHGFTSSIAHLFSGRAAAVFVVLAGMGLSLLGKRDPRGARGPIVRRAAVLAGIGFAWLPLWTADILHYYAFFLSIGALALTWSSRTLLTASAGLTALFPILFAVFDYESRWNWETLEYAGLFTPSGLVRHILFDGLHPLVPWQAFLFFGMWLGRQDLRTPRPRRRLLSLLLTTFVTVAATSMLLVDLAQRAGLDQASAEAALGMTPMPPFPTYILGSGSLAGVVVLLCIELAERVPLLAVRHAGQLALTLYVGHVFFLILPVVGLQALGVGLGDGLLPLLVVWLLGATAAAHAWRSRFARGPLEAALRSLSSTR